MVHRDELCTLNIDIQGKSVDFAAAVSCDHIRLHHSSLCDGSEVKQHLAVLRMLFDWLVIGHVIDVNPAHAVRDPKYVVRKGKTPRLTTEEARELLDSIPLIRNTGRRRQLESPEPALGLRDPALIAVTVYRFARINALACWGHGDRAEKDKIEARVWIGGLLFAALLARFVAFVEWRRPPENSSSLEAWLQGNGYSALLPFRDNIPPGTVLRIQTPGQSIAATADMVGLSDSEVANAPDMSWTLRSQLDALGDVNMFPMVADTRGAGANAVKVSVDHIRIREIPYVQLSDAARSNATLLRLVKDHDSRLVLVYERE